MKTPRQRPLKSIRENCLNCCGNQYSQVRLCPLTGCPLWFLRFGRMPKTVVKAGKDDEDLFNPENFEEGAKYGPDRDLASLELAKPRRPRQKATPEEGVS